MHTTKLARRCKLLSAISYPIAYLLSVIIYKITYLLNFFMPSLFPTIDNETCILSLVICINVIAIFNFFKPRACDAKESTN